MVLVAGASEPEAPVMAEVGIAEDEAGAADVTTEVAEDAAAGEDAGEACWLPLLLPPPPPPRSSDTCACAGLAAKSAAADSAATATMWLLMMRSRVRCQDGWKGMCRFFVECSFESRPKNVRWRS